MECYSQKTATFLILGDVCTRACRFCSVKKGKPLPPDPDEPRRVAEAARTLGLEHVVITCVTRDDLPDGGAEHFVRTIEEIGVQWSVVSGQGWSRSSPNAKSRIPNPESQAPFPTIEVLPSDFAGNTAAVDRLIDAAPEVYNHNTETVPRLFPVRGNRRRRGPMPSRPPDAFPRLRLDAGDVPPHPSPQSGASRSKTGLMLGLGETTEELLDTLADLLDGRLPVADAGPISSAVAARRCRWSATCRRRSSSILASWPGGWVSSTWPPGRSCARAITPAK